MSRRAWPISQQVPLLASLLVPLAGAVAILAMSFLADATLGEYAKLLILLSASNVILALSLNLVSGFTGQFSLGHAGFMAIGAYVSAFLATSFPDALGPFGYVVFGAVGGLAAALGGFAVGLPSLRLRGDYLAIVTLGFGEIIRVALLNSRAVGGARGMYGIPSPPFFIGCIGAGFWALVAFGSHWRLVHSRHGRAFMAVRDDEIAAEAMGIDATRVKTQAFVISSFFAGAAGSIYAHAVHYLNPSTFDFARSVNVVIMVVLGGMGSLVGSVFAAILVTLVPELALRPAQEWLRQTAGFPDVDLRMLIFATLLIAFMILRPQGLFGTREKS